jgi:hypothetical protein
MVGTAVEALARAGSYQQNMPNDPSSGNLSEVALEWETPRSSRIHIHMRLAID